MLVLSTGEFEINNINLAEHIPKKLPEIILKRTILLWPLTVRELLRRNFDIIHFFSPVLIVPILMFNVFNRNSKIIFEIHGVVEFELKHANPIKKKVYQIWEKLSCKFADEIIVMSIPMKRYIIDKYKISENKVHVIWGPVNTRDIPYKKPYFGNVFVVGYGGNDSWWQGVDTIFEVAKRLEKYKDIRFKLVGRLKKPTEGSSKNMEFVGIVPNSKFFEELSSCIILLSTRVGSEVAEYQYPQKLSTYLAIGRPIIATDVNDVKLILDKSKCGITIEPDDPDELVNTILEYYKRFKNNPKRLEIEGQNARKFAENNLTDNIIAERILKIYKR